MELKRIATGQYRVRVKAVMISDQTFAVGVGEDEDPFKAAAQAGVAAGMELNKLLTKKERA